MRLPRCLFTASVVVLWKAAGSTTARVNETDGPALANQANDPAPELLTFSSLQEAPASVVSGPLELDDASVDTNNRVQLNEEERVWTLPSPSDASGALQTERWLLKYYHPDDAFRQMTQQVSGKILSDTAIVSWLEDVHKYRTQNIYSTNEVVTKLWSVRNDRELEALFEAIRDGTHMKDFANKLLEELVLVRNMFDRWLSVETNPADVFDMLLVAEATSTNTVPSRRARRVERSINPWKLPLWIHYVGLFRAKNLDYSDADVVKKLASETAFHELPALLFSLRRVRGMKNFADNLQRALLEIHPSAWKTMFMIWLSADVNVYDVYHMLPVPATPKPSSSPISLVRLFPLLKRLKLWLAYVDRYAAKISSYPDAKLSELEMEIEEGAVYEVDDFFDWIQRFPSEEEHSDYWQKLSLSEYPDAVSKLLSAWQNEDMDPADVFVLSLRYVLASPLAASEKSKKSMIQELLVQCFQYVEHYNHEHPRSDPEHFSDDKLLMLLESKHVINDVGSIVHNEHVPKDVVKIIQQYWLPPDTPNLGP
uniref:RXLR phytopathogen effector protein WY-domain domain-containing protein n=1 Tax=Peronospora matthiolae TaxID=2874970 RepID=A0AAV1UEY1_9STRA